MNVEAFMADRRVGIWLVGALGGVGSTVALGLAALREQCTSPRGMMTALPLFDGVDLDSPDQFVLGGHDIRRGDLLSSVSDLARDASIFDPTVIRAVQSHLSEWSKNIRPGTVLNSGDAIAALADRPDLPSTRSPREAIASMRADISDFRDRHKLDQVVVVNVASTEPPFSLTADHGSIGQLNERLDDPAFLPVSSLYAYAAIDSGWPYVNFTPSTGASVPGLVDLAIQRGSPIAGQDGKTGETLLKSVLAPMFAARNLRILSWVGHNILGNRDGQVLHDPRNKAGKMLAKDRIVSEILDYSPQTHTSIEYIESLNDWKTAWDHVHFEGFLGVKMTLQFTWQGCDSALAAPLVIDLARLALLAGRRKESGILTHLACFFKSPMGVTEHDFSRQMTMLAEYVRTLQTR
jgi:myo-inositol-1-phosphate synthase